ncbi:MAG: hypothetical protein K0R72_416 [Clostridia bacterium]|jgi:hypothetical protein|nr:hypothetical protein [Clostridia bacterium]
MYFSDDLRIKLSKKFSFDLEHYVWNDELNDYLMNIKLSNNEDLVQTMRQVYEFGYNIGHCGLTSRYFAIALKKAELAYGTLPILIGTKGSKNGNHAWIINEGYVIDSTLRLMIPEEIAPSLGYVTEKILAYDSARMLSEYELFSRSASERNNNLSKYYQSLFKIE